MRPSQSLSGGEQQMAGRDRAGLDVEPARARCATRSACGPGPHRHPRHLCPALPRIKANGASVILVEQDIVQAMQVASRVYCFQEGRVSLAGRPADLGREQIHTAYFGT